MKEIFKSLNRISTERIVNFVELRISSIKHLKLDNKNGCLICGEDLVYNNLQKRIECFYCKNTFETNVLCKNHHYVCDECHSMPAYSAIETFCSKSLLKNPLEIAILLMHHPSIKMHGPEHHFLVAASLLTAYYNTTNEPTNKSVMLSEAQKRAKNILGGFCGYYGNCGAAVGTGIFMSLITHSTPLAKEEWKLCNLMTSNSLHSIAHAGGPRCCKRNTYLAIIEASRFVNENLQIPLKTGKQLQCPFSQLNRECKKEECKFYKGCNIDTSFAQNES